MRRPGRSGTEPTRPQANELIQDSRHDPPLHPRLARVDGTHGLREERAKGRTVQVASRAPPQAFEDKRDVCAAAREKDYSGAGPSEPDAPQDGQHVEPGSPEGEEQHTGPEPRDHGPSGLAGFDVGDDRDPASGLQESPPEDSVSRLSGNDHGDRRHRPRVTRSCGGGLLDFGLSDLLLGGSVRLQRVHRQVEAARHPELRKDAGQMGLDGSLGDGQAVSDLLVAGAGRDDSDELTFPSGETPESLGRLRAATLRARGELLQEVPGDAPSDPDLSGAYPLEGSAQERGLALAR